MVQIVVASFKRHCFKHLKTCLCEPSEPSAPPCHGSTSQAQQTADPQIRFVWRVMIPLAIGYVHYTK